MNLKTFVGVPLLGFLFALGNIVLFGTDGNFILRYSIFMLLFGLIIFMSIRKKLEGYVVAISLGLILVAATTFFAANVKDSIDISREYSDKIYQLEQDNILIAQQNTMDLRNIESLQMRMIGLQEKMKNATPVITTPVKIIEPPVQEQEIVTTEPIKYYYDDYEEDEEYD